MVDSQSTDDTGFEDWVKWVFDHPVSDPEWYWDENAEEWTASPVITVDYITRLLEEAPILLATYTDAQAAQGLWFLVSGIRCQGVGSICEETVLHSQRERGIRSIHALYESYFAIRCSPHLSHIDEQGANPLNGVCYMWWDLLPQPKGQIASELNPEVLATLERILNLNHDACTESALHGLGHWHLNYPEEATRIIDEFLASNPDIRQELRTYALQARIGRVL